MKRMGRQGQYDWSGMWHFHAEIMSHFKPGNLHSQRPERRSCDVSTNTVCNTETPMACFITVQAPLHLQGNHARCKEQAGACLWPGACSNWHSSGYLIPVALFTAKEHVCFRHGAIYTLLKHYTLNECTLKILQLLRETGWVQLAAPSWH